jgi:hypothetical protein
MTNRKAQEKRTLLFHIFENYTVHRISHFETCDSFVNINIKPA